MLIAKMEDIIIPDWIAKSNPSPAKIAECIKYYQTYGFQDRLITLNKGGELTDGYIMYLVLKMLGVKYAEVQYKGNRKYPNRRKAQIFNPKQYYTNCLTTYVFGKHVHGDDVERVWRIPMDKTCDLNVGDCVMVHACGEKVTIKVTRILDLEKPPVPMNVKTVCYHGDHSVKVNEDWVSEDV